MGDDARARLGAQPKPAGRIIGGKVVVGLADEERCRRWDVCENLSHQRVAVALKDAMNACDEALKAKDGSAQ